MQPTDYLPGDRRRLEAFRAGKPEVLQEVYLHYFRSVEEVLVHGFGLPGGQGARRFVGFRDPMDVQDRLQEIFERAFAKPARLAYDGVRPYLPYLLMIARNLVVDHLRSAAVRMERLTISVDELGEGTEDAVAEALWEVAGGGGVRPSGWEDREIVAVAEAFLGTLESRDHQVLRLRFRERRPQAEVAQALGMSAPTLRKLERRIFARFFEHMRAHGYLEHHALRQDLRTRRSDAAALCLVALFVALGGH